MFAISAGVWNRYMNNLSPVVIGLGSVSIDNVVDVARYNATVILDSVALAAVASSREIIENLASDPHPHYGISTGFGALATTFIESDRRAQLQASLIRSHAAGRGPEVEREGVCGPSLVAL